MNLGADMTMKWRDWRCPDCGSGQQIPFKVENDPYRTLYAGCWDCGNIWFPEWKQNWFDNYCTLDMRLLA